MVQNKIVAIHQPNFLPWLGFFHKYLISDVFIIGDSFQQPKTNGNWTTRVYLMMNKERRYLMRPMNRKFSGVIRVNEVKIHPNPLWVKKTNRTIEQNYKAAPYFKEVMPVVSDILRYETDLLWKFNLYTITKLLDNLRISTDKIVIQSDLGLDHLWKTELNSYLIEMTKAVGGNIYLSGDGSDGYQNEEVFDKAGIQIQYTKYKHPVYNQFNTKEFVPGLSIIDSLMNLGFEGTRKLLLESAKENPSIKEI